MALRVQLVVLIAQLKMELFDIGDRFRREQYLNHGRTILVYLVLKYLLVVQKRPATRKMNQYDFDGLMEQQFFVFLVSDAENKYYTQGYFGYQSRVRLSDVIILK